MARTIQNTARIDAPPATVWAVLTGFDERSEWDPYYREVRGELARGARLGASDAPGKRPPERAEDRKTKV